AVTLRSIERLRIHRELTAVDLDRRAIGPAREIHVPGWMRRRARGGCHDEPRLAPALLVGKPAERRFATAPGLRTGRRKEEQRSALHPHAAAGQSEHRDLHEVEYREHQRRHL